MHERPWFGFVLWLSLVMALAGCGGATGPAEMPPAGAAEDGAATTPTPSAGPRDILEVADFAPLEPGTYYIDPDGDSSTPLRVLYTIDADNWSQWTGAVKFVGNGYVAVSIVTVNNLVGHGCRDHAPADPPVGPSVDDLADALADLAPFEVTSPPEDVEAYGYSGKHLELTVPDLPVDVEGDETNFKKCPGGNLRSWISPPAVAGTFYGYEGPGQVEEFWILDVDGTRLMIAATWTAGSSESDLAELRAVLDSIQIQA